MSILIGLHIKQVLERDEAVSRCVGRRIYPLVIPQGTDTYPFVCYDTSGETGDTTKDGTANDRATVQLTVVAKSYEEAIRAGNAVRYALEGVAGRYAEFEVRQRGGTAYNDEYIEAIDAYAVNLSMEFATVDK